MRQRFSEWVRKLPIPSPVTASKRLAALDTDALFFSFNYTATLGTLYGVRSEQILFIHGYSIWLTTSLYWGMRGIRRAAGR